MKTTLEIILYIPQINPFLKNKKKNNCIFKKKKKKEKNKYN